MRRRAGEGIAMLHDAFLKSLRDQWRALLWWSLGVAAYVAMLVPFYSSIKKSAGEFDAYVENLPDVLREAFLGPGADFASPTGYLNTELFSWLVPIVFVAFGVGAGARALAGEEEAGTLNLLLAYPLTRRRLLLQKAAAAVVGIVVVGLALYAALQLSVVIMDMDVSAGALLGAVALGVMVGLAVGGIALAVSSATGRRAAGIAVGAGVGLGAYLLNTLAQISDTLKPYEVLSFFHYYGGAAPLTTGITWDAVAVLLGTALVSLVVALVLFERRDLRT
jgi:ABC-2 type transport system permease protein